MERGEEPWVCGFLTYEAVSNKRLSRGMEEHAVYKSAAVVGLWAHLYFKEVLGRAVNFLEGLLAGLGHGLHLDSGHGEGGEVVGCRNPVVLPILRFSAGKCPVRGDSRREGLSRS